MADRDRSQATRRYWIAWSVVAVVLCVPVWLTYVPPLSDFYNHLARLHILANHDGSAAYQAFYDVDWGPNPNLAFELLGAPLLAVFSLSVVGKLFLTLTILLWHIGATVLGRAVYGRLTGRALIVSFFVYNQQFLHGYCNFMFSMGLCLLALALWLGGRERLSGARTAAMTALATVVYFAHLSGFVTLCIAIAVMTAAQAVKARRITLDHVAGVVPLIPGTVLFFVGFLTSTGSGGGIAFQPLLWNVRDSMTILTGYSQTVDIASMVVVGALIAVVIVRRTRFGVQFDLLLAGLALGGLYWIFPSDMANGLEVNVRFVLGAVTLVAFAVDIEVRPRLRTGVLVAAMVLFGVRTGTTAASWIELDNQFQQHRQAFYRIDKRAALHNIYFYPAPKLFNAERVRGLALIHTPCFAAIEREANVPTLYAMRGQQVIAHREPLYRSHRFPVGSRPDIQWDEVFGHYQYVWACRAPPDQIAPLTERGELIAEVGACALYRL